MHENSVNNISESIIFSVSEVSFHLKQVIETQIESLYILGEISNFIHHNSGHMYFNLKDDNAVLRCAFFKNQNFNIEFSPQDGDEVVCFGKISVFEKSGQYQLIVSNMFPYGRGALYHQFEQLKIKLKDEGLFDPKKKKSIPKYPEVIGIITSPTGAALQDILNVLERRYPCKVKVFPALMQGADSPSQVVNGIKYFNESNLVDLVIIARGGGSQEDLFCFNNEDLAREIFNSKLPIVSAIGHEIDFTIADFVADLRAPTPSAAAELSTPNKTDLDKVLIEQAKILNVFAQRNIFTNKNRLQRGQIRIMQYNPDRLWQNYRQRYDDVVNKMYGIKEFFHQKKRDYLKKQESFYVNLVNQSKHIVNNDRYKILLATTELSYGVKHKMQEIKHKLELAASTLEESSPASIMKRGFSLVQHQGKIVKSVNQVKDKDKLDIIFSDGKAEAIVTNNEQK
jgi:exodeoxyribonuclease VII large subunit